ncbi:MAG: CCA tRNA nucleotidyltransferase [Acidimicrobiia bacterium]|nr:CCA tRNA nucleotidyltransferase [Acidimicrobiia bacterium]
MAEPEFVEREFMAERLDGLRTTIDPVGLRFAEAGHRLYLVGGIVRDLHLGLLSGFDIDLTTDAHPSVIKTLVKPLADAVWTQGERFGTIGASINGKALEITTHRAERYDPESRKPVVTFGDELQEDLSRRDFTINAMAVEVPGDRLHDPFGGLADLEARVLRTPLSPEVSFTDDPLRMLRAARFIARFELAVDPGVLQAAVDLAERIEIVSVERVADEIERLLTVTDPSAGFEFLRSTGLLSLAVAKMADDEERLACALASASAGAEVAGEVAPAGAGGSEDDEGDELNPLVRRAGLLWSTDVGAVLARLKYSNHDRATTKVLVRAVRDWIDRGGSTAADGRRLLNRVGAARPVRTLAANLAAHHLDPSVVEAARRLVEVVDQLEADDDVGPYHSPLTGAEIMAALDAEPGPVIGQAQKLLLSHRLDHGPYTAEEAVTLLRREFS